MADVAPTDGFMNALATAHIPAGSAPVLVLGAGPIERLSVGMRPRRGGAPDRRHGALPDTTAPTACILELIPPTEDQFLHLFVRFGYLTGGDTSYLWHLTQTQAAVTAMPYLRERCEGLLARDFHDVTSTTTSEISGDDQRLLGWAAAGALRPCTAHPGA